MYNNIDELIEINLTLLFNSKNHSLMRVRFRDEKGKEIIDSKRFAEYLELKGLIELEPIKGYRCDLTKYGYEIVKNGGWIEYLKLQSDTNEYLAKKEQLEFDNLKLQKENLEYIESIRKKTEIISDLTSKNLKLSNFDIKYRLLIFIGTFIIGLFTEYFTDFLESLRLLLQS